MEIELVCPCTDKALWRGISSCPDRKNGDCRFTKPCILGMAYQIAIGLSTNGNQEKEILGKLKEEGWQAEGFSPEETLRLARLMIRRAAGSRDFQEKSR